MKKLFQALMKQTRLFRNIRIQARLMFLFLLLSLMLLIVSGIFSYRASSSAIESKISTYSVQVMDQIGENIERELAKLEYDSIEIEFSDKVQKLLLNIDKMGEWDIYDARNRMKEDLVKKFSFLHDVSDVLIYTLNKFKIIAYGDEGFKLNLKKDYLDEYLGVLYEHGGAPVWRGINRDNEEHYVSYATSTLSQSKSNGVIIGRAIKSLSDGEIIGFLIIRTNERFFSNIYRNIDIGEGAEIFVVDSGGFVVSSRNSQIPVGNEYQDRNLIKRIKENNELGKKVFNFDIGDEKYLVAFDPLEKAEWFVVSAIPYSYLHSESKKIWFNIIILGVACFVLAVFLSYIFSASISAPLRKLVRAMKEAENGNLSVTIEDSNKDEIGEVARNFNNMLDKIKALLENVKNNEKQKRNAELKALQAQISPHFLSNTLNTVKWLASVQKAENIENIITSLIKLLHVSMGRGEDLISIREEIESLKSYLNIQEYRYYNKFIVNFEVEEDILGYKIPRFILQPVVENSLIHGIEPMEGQGLISVKGFKHGQDIKIIVTDNGVGISGDKLSKLLNNEEKSSKSRFTGIGIGNVHERLKLYFGDQYGLHIESVPNLYTTVEVTIPIIEQEA